MAPRVSSESEPVAVKTHYSQKCPRPARDRTPAFRRIVASPIRRRAYSQLGEQIAPLVPPPHTSQTNLPDLAAFTPLLFASDQGALQTKLAASLMLPLPL